MFFKILLLRFIKKYNTNIQLNYVKNKKLKK